MPKSSTIHFFVASAFIVWFLVAILILSGCSTIPKQNPTIPIIKKEIVIQKADPLIVAQCDGDEIKKSDVPDPKTATQKDSNRYTRKLEDTVKTCQGVVRSIAK